MDENLEEMDFDEIGEVLDWDNDTRLIVARAFISEAGLSEMLAEYARQWVRDGNV